MDQMIAELGREDFIIFIFLCVAALAVVIFGVVFFRGMLKADKKVGQGDHALDSSPYSAAARDLESAPAPHEEPVAPTAPVLRPVPTPPAPQERQLGDALEKTRSSFFGRIKSLFGAKSALSKGEMEELEEILYTSDLGPQTVQRLLGAVEVRMRQDSSLESVRAALKSEMMQIFDATSNGASGSALSPVLALDSGHRPLVMMIVGVNGAGKTTTIGKLASQFAKQGKKVMVAAGDTFRAAAGDQLKIWSDRAQVEIYSPEGVSDPSAVAFKAVEDAKAKNFDVVIVDTAGRLHTQNNLMEELKKMKRVIAKVIPDAPHEVLLVLDANSGQNALIQAREFNKALDVTGVILTKLDGSAKGGVAVGLAHELKLKIKLIGVGEGLDDLRQFSSLEFVDSIL